MEDNDVGIYKGKYYKAVEFKATKEGDIACKHCSFVLGQCRPAIMALGQCYIVENDIEIRNVYYEEITEEEFNKTLQEKEETKDANAIDLAVWMSKNNY